MNNFKKKNKFNNLSKRKLINFLSNNRYRRKSWLNAVPYIVKNKPQKYGPGKNLCVINGVYTMNDMTVFRISLQSMLLSNVEFSTRKLFYRYFKVLEIRAVFLPSGNNSKDLHYLNFSWNSIQESSNDIIGDDCTKIVPYYRPRTRIVRWRPIRSVINVNSVSQEVPVNFINMSEFISTDRVVSLPGWLYVSNTVTADQFMFEVVVEFRGNDYGDVPRSGKLNELEKLVEKMKKLGEENKKKHNNKIIDLIPAVNFAIEENKENNEENNEEIEKEIDLEKSMNKRESIELNYRELGYDNLEPPKRDILKEKTSKIEEERSLNDIEDPYLLEEALKFQEKIKRNKKEEFNNSKKERTGKEEIIKLESQNVITLGTQVRRLQEPSKEKRKENMFIKNKNLQGENSKLKELPNKTCEKG